MGVYKGETAQILHHLDPSRRLHLFDTFRDFRKRDMANKPSAADEVDFWDTTVDEVRALDKGNDNIISSTAAIFPGYSVSVHEPAFLPLCTLDADLYQPTPGRVEIFIPAWPHMASLWYMTTTTTGLA